MKKLILVLLVSSSIFAQKQYVGVFADVKNGVVGSKPTNNSPALDILIIGGVMDKHGITVEIGYESFKAIEFQKQYIGIGYTFISLNENVDLTFLADYTVITRDWKLGNMYYRSIGASSRLTYNFDEHFGVSLLGNCLLRTDNAERYHISTPKVFSTYLGIIYIF